MFPGSSVALCSPCFWRCQDTSRRVCPMPLTVGLDHKALVHQLHLLERWSVTLPKTHTLHETNLRKIIFKGAFFWGICWFPGGYRRLTNWYQKNGHTQSRLFHIPSLTGYPSVSFRGRTLPKTNSKSSKSTWKWAFCLRRKGSSSNHPFSGAMLLVSGRVYQNEII